jgi:hypothetical protein
MEASYANPKQNKLSCGPAKQRPIHQYLSETTGAVDGKYQCKANTGITETEHVTEKGPSSSEMLYEAWCLVYPVQNLGPPYVLFPTKLQTLTCHNVASSIQYSLCNQLIQAEPFVLLQYSSSVLPACKLKIVRKISYITKT